MADQAHRYVDQASFERYETNDGHEVTVSQLVNLPPAETFDEWLKHVWLGKNKEVHPGEGRGWVGHVRSMGPVTEGIIAAGEPQAGIDAIPSITYSAQSATLKDHLGYVRFIPDASSASRTLVVWNVKVTLSGVTNVLLCGGGAARAILRKVIRSFMSDFAKQVDQ